MTTDSPKRARFLPVPDKPEQRHDRDLVQGIVPEQDAHDQKMRKLKEHLSRPILAREADDPLHLHGDALRRHANLDAIEEHPYVRQVREHREARNQ
jgi:hypothetical protein